MGEIALFALSSMLAIYGATYLVTGLAAPSWFLDHLSLNYAQQHGRRRLIVWSQTGLTILGVGIVMYAATYALILAIPYEWGDYGDDGTWSSTRQNLQCLGALVGITMIFPVEENAELLVRAKWQSAILSSLSELVENSEHSSAELILATKLKLQTQFKTDGCERKNSSTRARERLVRDTIWRLDRGVAATRASKLHIRND